MWVIMATALPGYLPSVLRGDRLKKLAPARWATAWQTEVFPVRGAPYRSTALAQGSLQGGTALSLENPASTTQATTGFVRPVRVCCHPGAGACMLGQQCTTAQQHCKATCLQQAEPWGHMRQAKGVPEVQGCLPAAATLGPKHVSSNIWSSCLP